VLAVDPCQVKAPASSTTTNDPPPPSPRWPERFRTLVQLATWTSLRFGELAALTRADVDLRGNRSNPAWWCCQPEPR
jgi:integrase